MRLNLKNPTYRAWKGTTVAISFLIMGGQPQEEVEMEKRKTKNKDFQSR